MTDTESSAASLRLPGIRVPAASAPERISAARPKNLDSTYRGLVSVEEAVAQSINTVPVKLVAQMTPEYSYSFAKDKMGLSTLVSSYQSNTGEELSDVNLWALALGSLTRGVTVRSMTAAYASFANEGVWREARTYTVVKDANGQIILDNTQVPRGRTRCRRRSRPA